MLALLPRSLVFDVCDVVNFCELIIHFVCFPLVLDYEELQGGRAVRSQRVYAVCQPGSVSVSR